jgi:CHAD domain-containing protein
VTAFDRLAEAEALGSRLIEAIHDARIATRDLRAATKEARDVLASVRSAVDDRLDAEVAAGLERYSQAISEAIESATAAVDRRFATLADIMLGEDAKSRRQGRPSLRELLDITRPERD